MSDYVATTDGRDARWWGDDLDSATRAKRMVSVVSQIRKSQVWRKEHNLTNMRMYGNAPIVGFGLTGHTRPALAGGSRVSFNVVKNCSDAFVAKVTKDKPKVSFVTEGGDWDLQQKAASLEKFVEGQFYEMKLYQIAPMVVLDGGGIFGAGFLKFYIGGSGKRAKIFADRTFPWELLADEQEGMYGQRHIPALYQEKWYDRLRLAAEFPEKADAIRAAKRSVEAHTGSGYDSTADQIVVTEGWRLGTLEKDYKDGRHTIAIDGDDGCLLDEPWTYPRFPFVAYRRQESPMGFWGISLADDLDGIQREINSLLMKIQRAMYLLGAAHVLCESGARVNFAQWDNDQGSKITYTGVKPEVYTPPSIVSPEVYQHLDRLYNRAYEITGIPQPQAQGTVPSNLKSGKAQEVYLDVTDQRMQVAIDNYHDMFLEAADWTLCLGREIVKRHNKDFAVKAAVGRGKMRNILLSSCDMTEDEYVLKRWPTNLLSDDPATRIADVERMANAGWIDPDTAKRMIFRGTDLENQLNEDNASYDAVEDVISEMLNEGRYHPPVPFLNLEQAKRQVTAALIRGWRDKRPDARLQLLRDWLVDLGELQGGIGPAPVQTMAGAGGTPVLAPAPGKTPMVGPAGAPPAGPPVNGAPPPPPMAA